MNFKQMRNFVVGVERFLFQAALVFVVLLFVGQVLLSSDDVRSFLSMVDRLEGDSIDEPYQDVMVRDTVDVMDTRDVVRDVQDDYYLVLEMLCEEDEEGEILADGDFLEVHINKEPRASIGKEPLLLQVEPGDLLTMEGSISREIPVIIFIKETHDKMLHPHKGYSIYTFGEGEILGWVVVDED